MNLLWMAILSAVILLDKVLGRGVALSKLIGLQLVGVGVAMIAALAVLIA
jgi:predicted metal-binding membrane protein